MAKKNNNFNIYEAIANLKETRLFKNALRRYIENNKVKISNNNEFEKAIDDFKNKAFEVK